MQIIKKLGTALIAGIVLLGLAACQKNEPAAEKGPAEKAGEQIDQATSKAAEEINKAAAAAGQGLENAGEKLQGAAQGAQSSNEPVSPAQKQ